MKQLLTLIFILVIIQLNAQDGHFSQFYASPMSLNPALTGLSRYKLKATAQYREQWRSVTVPYVSMQGGVEGRFNQGYNNAIGGGLSFVNNEAGNANFTNSMMSHGPVIDNTESNRISWMRLPFPIKVYAISLTTDKDDEAGVNFTFSVRKDTDATYNSSTFTGSSTGSEVYFNSIVNSITNTEFLVLHQHLQKTTL